VRLFRQVTELSPCRLDVMGTKIWNKGDRVVKNNNTMPGVVLEQNGKKVLVHLETGLLDEFNVNDLKKRQ
jgi:hypothetical protein